MVGVMTLTWISISIAGFYAFDVQNFDNYEVQFDSSCETYLYMNGPGLNYLILYKEHKHIQLYIMSNNSWEMYISPWKKDFIFTWPEKLINEKVMTKIKSNGNVTFLEKLRNDKANCTILGFRTGSLANTPVYECEVYKCPEFNLKAEWWKIFIAICTGVLFLTVAAVAGPKAAMKTIDQFRNSRYQRERNAYACSDV